ncbi:MAG: hypothetical protein NDI69_05905 [Bacteriovoracaceae bacterium]|nr:hypothetical protein [Bacteriovoracaceae bacterium]
MINFEIQESPDSNVIAVFKYFQNQIYLGRNSGDLWINDNELFPGHVMLEVMDQNLLIHPMRDVTYFLINGKRATNIRKLKINDRITIGKTTIKIINFEETPQESKKKILDQKLRQLIDESSQRLSVIERLTQLMK